jgi:hypothetical protein
MRKYASNAQHRSPQLVTTLRNIAAKSAKRAKSLKRRSRIAQRRSQNTRRYASRSYST